MLNLNVKHQTNLNRLDFWNENANKISLGKTYSLSASLRCLEIVDVSPDVRFGPWDYQLRLDAGVIWIIIVQL